MTGDGSTAGRLPGMPNAPEQPTQNGLFEHEAGGEDSLREVRPQLKPRYTPDDHPLESFYIPLLTRSIRYDRAVGYWSAAELKFAAQGTARFLANGGTMRLIVGAQLKQADVDAVLTGIPLSDVLAARLLADPGLEGVKIIQDEHLSVLAWMVAHDRLDIRVGVPTDGTRLLSYEQSGKYFHTKYGVFTDRYGNRVAFNGSNNATLPGWVANHETFDVYPSWMNDVWAWNGEAAVADFERHWFDHPDAGWAIVPLPTAVREHLLTNAPDSMPLLPRDDLPSTPEGPSGTATDTPPGDPRKAWQDLEDLAQTPRESPYTAVGTAAAQPLPHQSHLIDRVVGTYPRGYLFADEVGLGKTIEAGLVLRELFISGRIEKALLLVPASVMKQWQEELHEKMNLDVPRYDKGGFVDRHDQPVAVPSGASPWSAFPIVLASSHLARRRSRRSQILDSGPWDVVLVDEAHHARRRGSKPTDTPNSLLALLLEMRDKGLWRALYLASATPMQMHPHEAWDLISLLGLKGRWGQDASQFLNYFERLRSDPTARDWLLLSRMLGDYFSDPAAERDVRMQERVQDALGFVGAFAVTSLQDGPPSADARAHMPNEQSDWMDRWLRRHTPLRDRVFRNTRTTLREYQAAGIIPADVVIPVRHVRDEFIELADEERKLYERIERYIRRHYNAYKSDVSSQALGFIMTVYRRRLTSSFEAIKKSLKKRLDVLEQGRSLVDLLSEDDDMDVEDALFDPDEFDVSAERLQDEIHELRLFLAELDKINGEDTKATQLVTDVGQALKTYSSVVVFTQYTDTMKYVRERLVAADFKSIGCYSGRGGAIYDPTTETWVPVTKSQIKERFRQGQLTVLIGTDSMSEGLNLQTCGRLINYDMPWNLMRVEQRIGRVDRIGATYKDIEVSNYFYKDTVEQQVYDGIAQDYGDFTEIIGEAAPVLATIERVIEQLALGENTDEADIQHQVETIRSDLDDLANRPVGAADLGSGQSDDDPIVPPPVLTGAVALDDLRAILTGNALTGPHFAEIEGRQGVYSLTSPAMVLPYSFARSRGVASPADYGRATGICDRILVTFDREVADQSEDDLVLLTYGTPELDALLPAPTGAHA